MDSGHKLPSQLCGDNTEFEKSVLATDPEGKVKMDLLFYFLQQRIEELENFKPTPRTPRPSTYYDEAAAAIIAENDWTSLPGYDATVLRTCSQSGRELPLAYFISVKNARREGRDPLAEENLNKMCWQVRESKKDSRNDPNTKGGAFKQFYDDLKEFIFVDLNIGCVDCTEDSCWTHDARVLEWDHNKSKKNGKKVSEPDTWTSSGIRAYVQDILCCTIRCRNHHRMKSHVEKDGRQVTTDYYERNPAKKRYQLANIAYREAIKMGDENDPEFGHFIKEINGVLAAGKLGACTHCDLKFDTAEKTYCCDFDHVNPELKSKKRKRGGDDSGGGNFSTILASHSTTVATTHKKLMKALTEEGGAQPLCSNCHTTK